MKDEAEATEEQKQQSVLDMQNTAKAVRMLADGLSYRMCVERSTADEVAVQAISNLRAAAGELEAAAEEFAKRKS